MLVLISLLFLFSCAEERINYYKPGGDQHHFDIESKECTERAIMEARSRMVDPKAEPDPQLVQDYYGECLYARGWGMIPLDQRDKALWSWKGNTVSFDDFTMELPSGFSLLTESKWVIGPAWSHQLEAAGPEEKTYLFLQAQESISDPIELTHFPRPDGFVFYTGDGLDKFDIRWSVFIGHSGKKLVGILGAYIYLEETRRISVVFSRTLTAPERPIVEGYVLSLPQKEELEELYPRWVSWIKAQTGAREIEKEPGLGRYFQFIW